MFLGNLATASENKERKKKSKKKKTKTVEPGELTANGQPKRQPDGKSPLYTEETSIPKEELKKYLTDCAKIILDPENIEEIIKDSEEQGIGLQVAAINFQRDILQNNYRIEKNFGCREMSIIPQKYASDTELVDLAKNFMFIAMKSYLMAIDKRYEQKSKEPSKDMMSRDQILEFFEACNAKMAMSETKAELKRLFEETKSAPNQRIVEMQREMLQKLGFDPDVGVNCLNRIGVDYPNDTEINMKMQYFAACAQVSCQIACFTEQEKIDFFNQIPPMMHNFPHMYLVQQRMHQQRMQQQQMGNMASGGVSDSDKLKSSGLLTLLSTPEGRQQVQQLGSRIQECKTKLEEDVKTWTIEKKEDYFKGFTDNDVVKKFSQGNPMDKIKAFLELNESDLNSIVSLVVILNSDDGRTVMKKLQDEAKVEMEKVKEAGGDETVAMTKLDAMTNVMNMISPLSNLKIRQNAGGMHSQSHAGHIHGSGECCHMKTIPSKDVSQGKSETIDR